MVSPPKGAPAAFALIAASRHGPRRTPAATPRLPLQIESSDESLLFVDAMAATPLRGCVLERKASLERLGDAEDAVCELLAQVGVGGRMGVILRRVRVQAETEVCGRGVRGSGSKSRTQSRMAETA